VKALKRREERENLDTYKAKQAEASKSSLGDSLDPELAAKLSKIGKES
jgi:hypothetical protein